MTWAFSAEPGQAWNRFRVEVGHLGPIGMAARYGDQQIACQSLPSGPENSATATEQVSGD